MNRMAWKQPQPRNISHLSPSPKPASTNLRPYSPVFASAPRTAANSTFKYMPYEKKIVSYEDRQYVERVPKVTKIVDYRECKIIETVPRETTFTDYYAVENVKQYHKHVVMESNKQLMPKQKKTRKLQYISVQKQIIHYPQTQNRESPSKIHEQSRMALQSQGIKIRPDAQFRQLDPTLLYKYSSKHRDQPVGYVEDGCKRNLSTAPSLKNIDGNACSIVNVLSPRNNNAGTRQDAIKRTSIGISATNNKVEGRPLREIANN